MKTVLFAATAAAAIVASAPAAAATFTLGGPTGTPSSVTVKSAGTSLTLTGFTYTVAPSALTSTTQFTGTAVLSRSSVGVGVCSEGGLPAANRGECPQVDANGSPNEILRADFSESSRISELELSLVDTNDTLRLYGLGGDGTTLNLLGFVGTIPSGAGVGVGTSFVSTLIAPFTYNLQFNPSTASYSTFFFTGNNDTRDGYRINSITTAIPEPATWAMMLLGFGLIGSTLRRSRPQGKLATA